LLQDWSKELNRVLLLIIFSGLVGALFGKITLFVLIALSIYLIRTLFQLRQLNNWLSRLSADPQTPPPESIGFWGDVFDTIFRLQQSERRASGYLKSILDKAQESSAALEVAVVLIDKHGNLEWWNKAGETMLGLRYPSDKKVVPTNLIRDPRFAEYFHNGNYDEPLAIVSPVDAKTILEFQLALFGEGERLMVVRDITKIHKLEVMRKDFVGNVSHELRTPITVISGYMETLLENLDGFDPRWHKPLHQIHQQSQRMELLVRDLLMLSQLETKPVAKNQNPVDVQALLLEVKNVAAEMFSNKAHTFEVRCDSGLKIKGDRQELFSAISNLVFNAAKYTADGGKIELITEKTEKSVNITVKDNGIGFEDEHIPRLTERFYRVDASRSTDTGGTGLGLAIVKHVLMRHNANLKISSKPGKGSKFICSFPLTRLVDDTELATLSKVD
jgi:two-component system, OmpR family, phosphate regulon sensor histidine kinase PhoR